MWLGESWPRAAKANQLAAKIAEKENEREGRNSLTDLPRHVWVLPYTALRGRGSPSLQLHWTIIFVISIVGF